MATPSKPSLAGAGNADKCLITARPETWTVRTLDRIEEQTGWRPQPACFAPKGLVESSGHQGAPTQEGRIPDLRR